MDSRRSVADQLHHYVLRQTGLITARYKRYAGAMKTEMAEPKALEKKPPRLARHLWHLECALTSFRLQTLEKWPQFVCQWRGKIFPSFSMKRYRAAFEINVRERKTCFRETTSLVPSNVVRNSHPFRRGLQRVENDRMLVWRDSRLDRNRLFADAETRTRIVIGETGFYGFAHHDSEELHFM